MQGTGWRSKLANGPSQYDLGSSHQEHDQSDHQNGPEYGRTVGKIGGQRKVESELMAREERVEHLAITPLAPSEAARFSQAWNALQGASSIILRGLSFRQQPQLVRELMLKRRYPMGDFERRAAEISVDHPRRLRELPGSAGD